MYRLKIFFPSEKTEWLLFLFFFITYGILGSYIAIHFRIIYDERIPWDAYFSFDNRAIVNTGGGFERHPLANYFFYMVRNIALFFANGKKNDIFRLVLALLSNLSISLSIVQIFKYLTKVISLNVKLSFFVTVFYGFFTTCILLSFTPETYTYTLLIFSAFVYYSAKKLKENQKISLVPLAVFSTVAGGLTITNFAKIFIPVLFERNLFKYWKNFANAALRVCVCVLIFVLLVLNRVHFDYHLFFAKTGEQYDKFTNRKMIAPFWDMVCSWFFGGNILFADFRILDYHNKAGFRYKALFMDTYSSVFPYIFLLLFFSLIFWAYFKNFRNKLVQILMISFLMDIAIHCILKFGIDTAYVYGGHFVFIFPLLLGWLLNSYKNSKKISIFLGILMAVLFIYLALNNLYQMGNFFEFLAKYYR